MSLFNTRRSYALSALVFVLSFSLVAATVSAATTISTNISTGGTLSVTGASTLTGAVSAAGAVAASSTLQVTGAVTTYGATTLGDAAGDTITANGAATFASTLGVTGAATLSSTLGVTGLTTLSGAASTTNASLSGALWVGGNATTTSAGAISTQSSLTVNGSATLGDAAADVILSTGTLRASSTLQSTGAARLYSTLDVDGILTAASHMKVAPDFGLDASSAGVLNIGTTTATTINIGRSGQTQALLGNATVAGTLTVTGTFTPAIASSTLLSVTNTFYAGGTATTTIDSAGRLIAAGQFQASSTALFGSGLTTYGNLTTDKAATTTWTFSQAGINLDANTLVLNPYSNRIGIGTSTPLTVLEVSASDAVFGTSVIISDESASAAADQRKWAVNSKAGTLNLAALTDLGVPTVRFSVSNSGLTTMTQASSTRLSVHGTLYVGGTATTTIDSTGTIAVNGQATTTASSGQFATNGKIGSGTSTPIAELSAVSSATSTLYLHSDSASAGGCIQLEGPAGTTFRLYATTTGVAVFESGTCK